MVTSHGSHINKHTQSLEICRDRDFDCEFGLFLYFNDILGHAVCV